MGRGGRTAQTYSRKQVAEHCTPDDAWIILDDKVYDVSGFRKHPGGKVVFSYAGQDATDVFRAFHDPSTSRLLPGRLVGMLEKDVKPVELSKLESDYRKLRQTFEEAGLFESNSLYYVYKTLTTVGWGVGGWVLLAMYPGQWWAVLVSAVMFGVLYQQCGWLSHDFLHHQVFAGRRHLGDAMGLFLGNVLQGFSVDWWKNKHNLHHAVPNLHETATDAHDGDPDVDTLPVLAWSSYFAKKASAAGDFVHFLVRNQVGLFWPTLMFARFAWMDQSVRWVAKMPLGWGVDARKTPLMLGVWEPLGLASHFLLLLIMSLTTMTLTQSVVHFFLSNATTGIILAAAFVVGHNGMDMIDAADRPSFIELQLRTTRNIDDDMFGFTGWFMGGLHYQIEHHLFPTIPRHNLHKASPFVKDLATKHNLPYHSTGFFQGLAEVMQCLDDVANEFVRDFPAA